MLKVLNRFLLAVCLPFSVMAHGASVVFVNPGYTDEKFWISYSAFMQAAASSLGMQLEIKYAERSPHTAVDLAREALQGNARPDYLVFVNEQYIAPEVLRLAQGSGVKVFMVNNGLTAAQAQVLAPAGSAAGWLGSMVTNDEQAGYLMLSELIRLHGPASKGRRIELLAFSGAKNTPAAQRREKGLQRALAEHQEVRLRQMVQGEWSEQRAFEQASQLLKRYPDIDLIWSANDEMALGAMKALEATGRVPGRDVLFGAVNSSQEALKARIAGRLSVLVAGHFTLGGWAMVLLNDDSQGIDFSRRGGADRVAPLLQLIDVAQAKRLLAFNQGVTDKVDFKRFSARGKAPYYQYPFSLQAIFKAP